MVYRRRLWVYSFRNNQSINLQHSASQHSSKPLTSTSLMRFPFSSVPSSFLRASFISLLLANSRTLNKTNQIKNKKVTTGSWKHTSTVVEQNFEDGWCQVCTGRGRGGGGNIIFFPTNVSWSPYKDHKHNLTNKNTMVWHIMAEHRSPNLLLSQQF